MSALSRFMHTARAILDERDRKAAPKPEQPPFFVRTNWLFAELEELAMPGEVEIFMALKVARLRQSIGGVSRLLNRIVLNTEAMESNRTRHERRQLCAWINEQIEREGV